MTSRFRPSFLRTVLAADAVVSGTCALLLIAGAGLLEIPLGLDAGFLRLAGLSLIPFVGLLVYLLRQAAVPRGAVWVVIACNAVWAIDSILLLFTSWIDPTTFGQIFVVLQAVVVFGFAELQYLGLRRLQVAGS